MSANELGLGVHGHQKRRAPNIVMHYQPRRADSGALKVPVTKPELELFSRRSANAKGLIKVALTASNLPNIRGRPVSAPLHLNP